MNLQNAEFDYVIIGAGSAGCAIANRLASSGNIKVLLVEAGGRPRNPWLSIPIGVGKILSDDRYSWNYQTESEPGLGGRSLVWNHGRMVGGTSGINGMLFVRGEPRRYDEWRDADCPGWGYQDVLPHFKRLEAYPDGDPLTRGKAGPVKVRREQRDDPVTNAFVTAGLAAGLPLNEDYNDGTNEGVAACQFNIHRGRRWGAARAYLSSHKNTPGLTLLEHALAERIVIEERRATGCIVNSNGTSLRVKANSEVILAAGAIHSPMILEHSGVGDAQRLQSLGITVQHHLPGVGENLRDHLHSRVQYECNAPVTANDLFINKWFAAKEALRYGLFRGGILRVPTFKVTAFARSPYANGFSDLRLQCALSSGLSRDPKDGLDKFSGFHLGGYFIHPTSRGYVHIESPNFKDPPRIRANYLATESDIAVSIEAMKLNRHIAAMPAMQSVIVRETHPGPDVQSDAALADYLAQSGHTSWHPIGTCKMGRDEQAVVDESLRVRGIDALRVADASVMPFHVSSNTNIPAIMIGEKASDLILGNRR